MIDEKYAEQTPKYVEQTPKKKGGKVMATVEGDDIVIRINKHAKLNRSASGKSWIVAQTPKPARKIDGVTIMLTAYTLAQGETN